MKACLSGNISVAGLAVTLELAMCCQAALAQVTTARLEGVIKD
jgi:hypothetical protein